MELFRFDENTGRTIDRFDSISASISRIVRTPGPTSIGCIHLGAGGVLGYHPAVVNQLLLVIQGQGWVRGEDEQRIPIQAGQAAFWIAGEGHESGSDEGMSAIVVEGEGLDPKSFMSIL